ncbi:MAG TPA: sulfite exporter TauE/SafE family protein [Methylomirabilota bacterium]|nr:sulfite exporter TauE/SafE family protein [Methylomirabilota bacterium]
MTLVFAVTLVGLGVLGAFIAGLLGVGGALVMIPLLLYVPPLLGVGALDVKAVAAVTMAQVFVAALSGVIAHRRHKFVNADLALVGGVTMAAGSFVGALVSKHVNDRWLLIVFALMVTAAALLMLTPVELLGPPPSPVEPTRFSRPRTIAVAGAVGLAAGFVGAGGAFLLVPLLLIVVGVPIRVTIGSSLAITALAATAGFAGKLVTGQIPPEPAIAVALGALPGAQIGAAVSRHVKGSHLKLTLLVIIVLTGVRVWWDVLFQ